MDETEPALIVKNEGVQATDDHNQDTTIDIPTVRGEELNMSEGL